VSERLRAELAAGLPVNHPAEVDSLPIAGEYNGRTYVWNT